MKVLYQALRDHVRSDLDPMVYGLTILLLSVSIFINYSPLLDIGLFQLGRGTAGRVGYYSLLFGGTYLLSSLIASKGSEKRFLSNKWFWVTAFWLVLIATLPKFHYFKLLNVRSMDWHIGEMHFVSKCQFFLNQLALTAAGLMLLWVFARRHVQLDFGLRADREMLRPYMKVLLIIAPLIVAASFLSDFQQAYPQYRPWRFDDVFGLPQWFRAVAFELSYASGFLAVETLFRGAMVLTMAHLMGKRAVLVMASLYCVFHFGKPAGEAIAAFFGGYALGVLALHSRSVLGGLLVHLGVAMLMETMAYLHHLI